jgi:hypothetical protein
MEGDPRAAAEALVHAREALYEAMLELMARGDILAAFAAARTAGGDLETLQAELAVLARVNGLGGDLDALAGSGNGSGPAECPVCGSDDPAEPLLAPAEPFALPVGCTHPWHEPLDPTGRARREGMCRDGRTCTLHCGTGPCSRSCPSCGRLAWTGSPPCGACPDREAVFVEMPAPDPDTLPAVTLLSNRSLAGYPGGSDLTSIPASDVGVELIAPATPTGIKVGVSKGVRLTHLPTGTIAISTAERSQLQNMQRALENLAQHHNVMLYTMNQRCTHGADCTVHPDTMGLHNFDGVLASELPVHDFPQHRRDPR